MRNTRRADRLNCISRPPISRYRLIPIVEMITAVCIVEHYMKLSGLIFQQNALFIRLKDIILPCEGRLCHDHVFLRKMQIALCKVFQGGWFILISLDKRCIRQDAGWKHRRRYSLLLDMTGLTLKVVPLNFSIFGWLNLLQSVYGSGSCSLYFGLTSSISNISICAKCRKFLQTSQVIILIGFFMSLSSSDSLPFDG